MWKKERDEVPATPPGSRPGTASRPEGPEPARGSAGRATIGRSITIRGEVTGDEDLVIEGRVEGSVNLDQHAVTVGSEGDVKADITARVVIVEGRVVGNLSGDEQVVLRKPARVEGDIVAPRVVFEDGILFRGSVEMSEAAERGRQSGPRGPVTSAVEPARIAAEASKVPPPGLGERGSQGQAAAAQRPEEVGR